MHHSPPSGSGGSGGSNGGSLPPSMPSSSQQRQQTLFESWGQQPPPRQPQPSISTPSPMMVSQPQPQPQPLSMMPPPMLPTSQPMPAHLPYQPTLQQMAYGQFGKQALSKASSYSKADITKEWRMSAVDSGYGGHGMDELQRTSLATQSLSTMSSHASDDQLMRTAALLSMDRVDTASLVWFASDSELGGHPGALRSQSQMSTGKGTTNLGHHSRDTARVKAVMSEGSLMEGAARAKAETIRTMSAPTAEFADRVSTGFRSTLTHAVAGDLAGPQNMELMGKYVGDQRELLKWDAASEMLAVKASGHVPPVMRKYLIATGNIPRLAAAHWHADLKQGAQSMDENTQTRSQAGKVAEGETLVGTHLDAEKGHRPRALSNPRQMFAPPAVPPKHD